MTRAMVGVRMSTVVVENLKGSSLGLAGGPPGLGLGNMLEGENGIAA